MEVHELDNALGRIHKERERLLRAELSRGAAKTTQGSQTRLRRSRRWRKEKVKASGFQEIKRKMHLFNFLFTRQENRERPPSPRLLPTTAGLGSSHEPFRGMCVGGRNPSACGIIYCPPRISAGAGLGPGCSDVRASIPNGDLAWYATAPSQRQCFKEGECLCRHFEVCRFYSESL